MRDEPSLVAPGIRTPSRYHWYVGGGTALVLTSSTAGSEVASPSFTRRIGGGGIDPGLAGSPMSQLICSTPNSPLMPSATTRNRWPAFTPGISTEFGIPTEPGTTSWTLLVAQPSSFVGKAS